MTTNPSAERSAKGIAVAFRRGSGKTARSFVELQQAMRRRAGAPVAIETRLPQSISPKSDPQANGRRACGAPGCTLPAVDARPPQPDSPEPDPHAGGRRTCGTPGCTLPDFHAGPCSHERVQGDVKRKRSSPQRMTAAPSEHATPEKPRKRARPRVAEASGRGEARQVDRLLGCQVATGGARRFAVRYKGLGAKGDSWEAEADVDPSAVAAFDSSPLCMAPWRGGGQLFLVERVLQTRNRRDGRKQSQVQWLGFDWPARWLDDDKLVRSGSSSRHRAMR